MRSLILSVLLLQLLLPGTFSESEARVDERKPKPVMCKNPKAKEGSAVLQGCSTATCAKVGKKGMWQQCPPLALETTVLENQRKIDRNHELLKEILEILGQPNCCPTIQTTTWEPASTTSEGCGDGWTEWRSHCYKFVGEELTWNDAQARCEKEGSNLASVHSAEENQFLVTLSPQDSRVMIGGNDKDTEGAWVWTDGSAWDYSQWKSGQPDDYEGDEDCMELYTDTNWNDVPCDSFKRGGFICKKK